MKILLADDHTLFREILVHYILSAIERADIVHARNLEEGKHKLANNPGFDLVLLDLKMPGMNGLGGLRELIAIYNDIPIAIMSGVASPDMISEALEIGASGYFPKTMSGQALIDGIQRVLSGERFVPVDLKTSALMPSHYHDGHIDIPCPTRMKTVRDIKLTPREKEVLGYLLKGRSNKEIANELGLQLVTVKLHVRGICTKLEAENRTQAALRAKELQILNEAEFI